MTVDHAVTALDYESGNIYVFTASTSYDTDVTVRSNDARDKYVKWSIEVQRVKGETRSIGEVAGDFVRS